MITYEQVQKYYSEHLRYNHCIDLDFKYTRYDYCFNLFIDLDIRIDSDGMSIYYFHKHYFDAWAKPLVCKVFSILDDVDDGS